MGTAVHYEIQHDDQEESKNLELGRNKKESSRVHVPPCLQRDSETRQYTTADYRLSHNLAPLVYLPW
jgi:hypothetical protein